MNRSRFITALWSTAILSAILVGSVACASVQLPPPLSRLPAAPTESAVTLSLWHTQTGPGQAQLNALASDFSQTYPWIKVQVDVKGDEGDLLKQGIAAAALNQPPDLLIASPRTIAEFARRNALAPLNPFLDDATVGLNEQERNDLLPGALTGGFIPIHKNQPQALPFDAHAIVLYYNGDYMRAAKFNLPPRRWEEFGDAARSTTRGTVHGWVMAPDAAVLYALIYSRGGAVLNDTQTEVQLNGSAVLQSVQLISALSNGGAAYLAPSVDKARADFAEGKAAFWFGSTHDLNLVSAAMAKAGTKFEWGIAGIPRSDAVPPTTVLLGSDIAIFRSTDARQRAAWLFMRWLTMPDQSARWSRATLALPTRLSAIGFLIGNWPPNVPSNLPEAFGDTLPTGRGVPTVKGAEGVDQAVVEMWTSVAAGADPNAAIQRAAQRATRALGQAP